MGRIVFNNAEDEQLHALARGYKAQGNFIKALEVIEDSISIRGKDKFPAIHLVLQGTIFHDIAKRTENSDLKFVLFLGAVECFSQDHVVHAFSGITLFNLAAMLGSALYYRKALKNAKASLSLFPSFDQLSLDGQQIHTRLENIVRLAESKLLHGVTVKISESKHKESEEIQYSHYSAGQRLRPYWAGMSVESKRNLMKVSISVFRGYVERLYGREGQDALEQAIDFARNNRKWKFWMCRTCSQKFFYSKKFKTHLEQVHSAKFKPSTTRHMPQRVDEAWGGMICVAGWEPVDAVAASEMINTRLEFVKEFVYENGWCKDWPLSTDEERSKLLKELQLILVSLWEHKILSCSIRDWMMRFLVKYLAQFEVSEHTLTTECRLVETPQSICFLEFHELSQILDLLKRIKCERHDGTHLVCRAVESLWSRNRVKEKIEFDHEFSFLLLDRRLLRGDIASFDDEGTIDVCDHNVYYAKTHPQGDDLITWLLDYPLIDANFEFPRSIRGHNLDMCVAVLRAIQFTCGTLGTKYTKKLQILGYDAALIDANNLFIQENERRMNIPEDQWKRYASLLCDGCEENLTAEARNSLATKQFLCAVRDVLEGASHPTFDFPNQEDCLNLIRGHKNLSDDQVLDSIDILKSVVTNKVLLADSKILLVENSRISLLNDLVRLSVCDHRSDILRLLKRFLREELEGMDAKAKLAAAEAELLFEEIQEEKDNNYNKSGPNMKKGGKKKKTSTSICSPPHQNAEHEPEAVEEVSIERDRLDISSNTNNQEEATKDIQTMPEEVSQSEHLESALGEAEARYNSAGYMTLKALLNIKVLKEDINHNGKNLEEQVPWVLRNFFSAFVSDEIENNGIYSSLLSDLLPSLAEVHPMPNVIAEVVVAILEFWHCWKSRETESLVTRLFTLEEYERMSCRKCRRNTNHPEQSSYGIVVAADSIKDLKCAFGNVKFEDILKIIRMGDKMLCDSKRGGCGKKNFVHHIISSCPRIFTILLEWEKYETEKDISETIKALDWEIDISRLYEGLEPKYKYRLVSMVKSETMVGCGEEKEHVCLAYKQNLWVSLRHEALVKENVGNWKSLVRFCGERKVQPEILFYEAVR